MKKKEEKEKRPQMRTDIHFTIPAVLKRKWKRQFKARGHGTLKSGIVAAVFNYLNLQHTSPSSETNKVLNELRVFMENLDGIKESIKKKKTVAEEALQETTSPPKTNKKTLKNMQAQIREKIETYQPVAITFLSQLLNINGPKLLPILKTMAKQKIIKMNKTYEWELHTN